MPPLLPFLGVEASNQP